MRRKTSPTKVGSRSEADIIADPLADDFDVRELARWKPVAALQHPNCPVDLWWVLAEKHPFEAMNSILFEMLTLEAPERWTQLEEDHLPGWMSSYAAKLSREARKRLAVDYAEHVLPFYEVRFPTKKGLRKALGVARRMANESVSETKVKLAKNQAGLAQEESWNVYKFHRGLTDQESLSIASAYRAANCVYELFCGWQAAQLGYLGTAAAQVPENAPAEMRWQWARMLHYLREEAPKASKVGGRRHQSVLADPQATAAEITSLAKTRPIEAVQHPNCPVELWWKLAITYPREAKASVLFGMMTMEDPARWIELARRHIHLWVEGAMVGLPRMERDLLAADCAERVLPLFTAKYPWDERPLRAIQAHRLFAQGKFSERDLEAAIDNAAGAARMVPGFGLTENFSAQKAAWACARYNPVEAAKDAAAAAQGDGTRGDAWVREREWQWERAQQYARNEVSLVGGRADKNIMDNPMAPPAQIRKLSEKEPLQALSHPNCPIELWWELAARFPLEAPSTPAGQLFLLEDPARWEELERDNAPSWIAVKTGGLSDKDRQLFAADCAAHVLSFFESNFHDELRGAITMRRKWAKGEATQEQWAQTYSAVEQIARKFPAWGASMKHSAVRDLAWAIISADSYGLSRDALVYTKQGEVKDIRRIEAVWQWHRLKEYLKGEPPKEAVGARTYKSIKANPQAASLDVYKLSNHDRLAALNHPNCPLALWMTLAVQYPAEALASPAGAIFLLEDPELWERIEKDHIGQWISNGTRHLSATDNRLFACDCAEHVLPLPKVWHEEEAVARRVIAVARAAVHGNATSAELAKAYEAIEPCVRLAQATAKGLPIFRALSAAQTAADPDPPHAVRWTCYNASIAASSEATEKRWQWRRQQEYLRGEVSSVGARFRTNKQLMADPMAAEDDLYLLARKRPLLALAHPNCPVDLWWELAERYPIQAETSVLYPILTLESPDRWKELEANSAWSWTYDLMKTLPPKIQYLFAAECAERVLPIWEADFPKDKRPRQAIATARAFGLGKATQRQLQEASKAALASETDMSNGDYMHATAANAAAFAASKEPIKALAQASQAVEDEKAEDLWQLYRVREYLAKLQKKDT